MEFQGKKICGLEITDNTKGGKVIATICDDKTMTTNGFVVSVIPYTEEVKAND